MDRKKFIKQGLMGMGAIVALPSAVSSCSKEDVNANTGACALAPAETAGPFPIKTPAALVRENIISDRTGIALLVTLNIQDQSDSCKAAAGAVVDIWHCDAEGNYSQYGGSAMQTTDYTTKDFLRGRQTADTDGKVSFITIFPGWYPGRAPHIHVEVSFDGAVRDTQIAFPKDICDLVYATAGYNGTANTQNASDNVFSDSLTGNMADSVTGNVTDGYTLLKTIVV